MTSRKRWFRSHSLPALTALLFVCYGATAEVPTATRLGDGPIVTGSTDARIGTNVQGPSLIQVPDWPGSLHIEESHFPTTVEAGASATAYAHIASPDVHVRDDRREIVMYLHGRDAVAADWGNQVTRLATSEDGIHFQGQPTILARPYLRVVKHGDFYYALAMPGYLYRSRDGIGSFESGPRFFNDDMRHAALLVRDDTLYVFWTQVGDAPERILVSTIDMQGDWMAWQESEPTEILRPEYDWEGADLEIEPSSRGYIDVRTNQLRDPAIYREGDSVYLLYSVAGESGIAIAELDF